MVSFNDKVRKRFEKRKVKREKEKRPDFWEKPWDGRKKTITIIGEVDDRKNGKDYEYLIPIEEKGVKYIWSVTHPQYEQIIEHCDKNGIDIGDEFSFRAKKQILSNKVYKYVFYFDKQIEEKAQMVEEAKDESAERMAEARSFMKSFVRRYKANGCKLDLQYDFLDELYCCAEAKDTAIFKYLLNSLDCISDEDRIKILGKTSNSGWIKRHENALICEEVSKMIRMTKEEHLKEAKESLQSISRSIR